MSPNIRDNKSNLKDTISRRQRQSPKFLTIRSRYIVPILCLLIIVVRIIWDDITFDETSLWLFVIAVIVILIPDIGDLFSRIKKFKKGDIEIEFETRIAQLALNTEKVEETAEDITGAEYLSEFSPSELRGRLVDVTRDPRAGLIALAVEIGAALTMLSAQYGLRDKGQRVSVHHTISELSKRSVLPKELPSLLRDFWTIRNEAVHSISFQPSEKSLYEILDLGIRILRILSVAQHQENRQESAN